MRRLLGTVLRLLGVSIYVLRLHPLVIRLGRNHPRVLVYHACHPTESPYMEGLWTNTPPADLASQLDYLERYYEVVPLTRLESNDLPPRAVVITFDDGYRSVYRNAFPLLVERELPATIYLVTAVVDNGALVWVNELAYLLSRSPEPCHAIAAKALGADPGVSIAEIVDRARASYDPVMIERLLEELRKAAGLDARPEEPLYLDREEIGRMAEAGITFGSHTVTHPNLARLSETAQRAELAASRDYVAGLPGGCASLAYPFGNHTAATRDLAVELGYTSIMEVGGTNDPMDPRRVARVPVNSGGAARLFAEMEVVNPLKALALRWRRRDSGSMA